MRDIFPCLSRLDPTAARSLFTAARKVRVSRNQQLFMQDDPSQWVFYVVTGGVLLYRVSPSGEELGVAYARSGGVCGLEDAIAEHCYSSSARTTSESLLLRLSSATLQQHIRTVPDFTIALNRFLANRCHTLMMRTDSLMGESLEYRLVLLLKSLANDGRTRNNVRLRLSQGDIAALLGASRQRTNSALRILQKGAVLDCSRNEIIINKQRLRGYIAEVA